MYRECTLTLDCLRIVPFYRSLAIQTVDHHRRIRRERLISTFTFGMSQPMLESIILLIVSSE